MNIFNKIRVRSPRYNKFNLSHEKKMTLNMGKLYPILCEEILPGDKWRVKSECMLRMAPLLAPIMHRVNVRTEFFFVPNRLVWDEWEDFITGGKDGDLAPVMPNIDTQDAIGVASPNKASQLGSLWDYLGLPRQDNSADAFTQVSALPFRAYQLIWDEYYRDQNLTDSLDISKASGGVTGAELEKIMALRDRCWEKDYFTSALPEAQRGPQVEIPIDINADAPVLAKPLNGGTTSLTVNAIEQPGSSSTGLTVEVDQSLPSTPTKLWARLDNLASSTTINELRRSIKLQEWLEKMMRSGARYVEQLKAFFGVTSSDARLQRPEYLSGSRAPFRISEVLSTVNYTNADPEIVDPLGTMGGHGVSASSYPGFKRRFEEHGYVIGIMSVLPNTNYQDGIPRAFRRFDKFDYYWPEFAHLGEQAILNNELFFNGLAASVGNPTGTWGYTPRYSEYKFRPSTVHGAFKSELDFWVMTRKFTSLPDLNEDFVQSDPTTRIFAVEDIDTDKLYCHIYHDVSAIRPMPYFGTPTL